ncbi:hypothetical protein [Curtobacterium sp. VKM Ac-1393]|uniref:hypothetical protein n=1 Tax=Curtobacterium sp. VKM Ac-1393 TaxID=2783814 RepID=UPI00188BA9C6|nr:hypothetical protein [Curtobacterium sp. VKM Ac-1393]MBF4605930.1 hypothetical protein [Curtobacterium sp. VKM Ac-1393]
MTLTNTAAPAATTYDYCTVDVPRGKDALYADTYRNFGWTPDGSERTVGPTRRHVLGLRRDRSVRAVELTELQQNAETALATIDALERSRTTAATVVAYALGAIGSVLLAGSVFAMQDTVAVPDLLAGLDPVTVFLVGAGGLVNWAIAPVAFHLVRAARTKRIRPAIDRQFDVVYGACEAASRRRSV